MYLFNVLPYKPFNFLKVDYVSYADEIAIEVGCKPDLFKLLFSDPALALRCFFGPCTPAQYRLMGPGTWEGAKKAIEDAPGNVIYATKTRVCQQTKEKGSNTTEFCLKLLVIIVVIVAIFMKFYA